ncbi:MAG: DUF6600 domain-containing protein [Undibacterium umbellatum]|uniref:DUF6600 domain-containing protein n=1 Tax=Undibacterium umbellatum TaxID=2762300 RepID=UPI003BB74C3C
MPVLHRPTLLARVRRAPLLKFAALAVASLFVLTPVHAQDEPPGRVARVSYSHGNISFADAGSNDWTALMLNRPISTGDSLQVPYAGKAELRVGPNVLRMQENTRISFNLLDDDNTQIDLNQGGMVVRVRELSSKENFDIRTPNMVFSLQEPGEYKITVNPDNSTTVQVRRGTAIAHGERDTITIRQGEQTRFMGSNLQHNSIGTVSPHDAFDLWAADRDRAEENLETVRYVSREVIGYEQLDQYGVWETTTNYGAVWYPRQVSASWAPYRDGNWVYVAPWGWTWVDRAPWGFAPYHYGRWAYVGTRWAWVPGPRHHHHRPVYAPALVAFVGGAHYIPHKHGSKPSVAWFPLGPGEVYRPGYTRNTQYIQRLNQSLVVNNSATSGRYVNQGVQHAITVVPTTTFTRGEHVMPVSSSRLVTSGRQTPVALTEAPSIAPGSNNRFGEARQQNWRDGDQYRQRNLVLPATRTEQRLNGINNSSPNEGLPVSRPAEVNSNPTQGMRPVGAGLITPNTGVQSNNVYAPRQPANIAPQPGNAASINIAPAVNAPTNNNAAAPNQIRPVENGDRAPRPGSNWNNEPANNPANNQPRQYGNGMPNNGNTMPGNANVYNPRTAQPATINVVPAVNQPATQHVNPPVNQQPQHTPSTNTPVNNAIMGTPNPGRPVENNDRGNRPGSTWNNNGQQELRGERQPERNVDRGNDRSIERRPSITQMERPVQQAPLIQPPPQPQPIQQAPQIQQPARMESRPAPMPMPSSMPAPAPRAMPAPAPMPMPAAAPVPRAMPAPTPAPAPAPAERSKEKDDARNAKMRGLSER